MTLVEDAPVFKELIDKRLKTRHAPKILISLAGPVLQLVMALTLACQTLGKWAKLMARDPALLHINLYLWRT